MTAARAAFRVEGLLQDLAEDGADGFLAGKLPLLGCGGFGLDRAAQAPAVFHPVFSGGDGPGRVAGEVPVTKIVVQKLDPPRPVRTLRQAPKIAQELRVGGAGFLGIVDQGVESVNEILQPGIGGRLGGSGRLGRVVPGLVLLRRSDPR